MIAEQSVEYFYGETLRWSFGFDNPNKAAVIFACLLPFLFYCGNAGWGFRNVWLRVVIILLVSASFLAAGYCLCMTFSRGALVAAVAGLVYVAGVALFRNRGRPVGKWIAHFLLLGAFGFLVIWTGLGTRTGEAAKGDRSVGNRFDLWSAALQMSVENPTGFGAGRSGAEYMQWYQEMDREEGYRTMVNSYLTFLVEYGWAWFGLILIVFTFFWTWTSPGRGDDLSVGLRGLLVAFLVAGIFSTKTMEEWRLWILPCLAVLMLAVVKFQSRQVMHRPSLAASFGIVVAGMCILVGKGWSESSKDTLRREFSGVAGGSRVVGLAKKGAGSRVMGIVPDPQVLGELHGKLFRELALEGSCRIVLGADAKSAGRVILVGRAVRTALPTHVGELILLAPEIVEPSTLEKLKQSTGVVRLLLGEIDEDGRIAFWTDIAEREGWEVAELFGVGTRVDWAWEEITAILEED